MKAFCAKEFKVTALRECLLPEQMHLCDTPDKAADYWRMGHASCSSPGSVPASDYLCGCCSCPDAQHRSGEAAPSEADIKVTRDLIKAGQLLKIEVPDHVILGAGMRQSLRELGYFL